MWLFFAILAGALFTAQGLLTRHLLKGQKDAWAFSFYFSLVGAMVSLPFMLSNPVVPTNWQPWLLVVLVGLLIVGQNLLSFKASNYIQASLSGAIAKFRLVWVFVLGIIVAQTAFSWTTLLGTLFTVSAGLLIFHHFKQPKSLTGVWLAFSATIFYAGIIILYKYLFASFNAVSLTFFVSFLPAVVLNFVLMPQAWQRIRRLFKDSWLLVSVACGVGALANLALNQGLALGQASGVLVIIEAFLILTLVGEHILLKEKEQLWVKVAAVLLAIIGAVLIRLHG